MVLPTFVGGAKKVSAEYNQVWKMTGKSGYSYRDGNKGTYLFFSHAGAVITYEGKDDKSGSTDGAAGIIAGGFGGFVIASRRRRK